MLIECVFLLESLEPAHDDIRHRQYNDLIQRLEHYLCQHQPDHIFGSEAPERYREEYAPVGVNVNFAEIMSAERLLRVRTYEKGVEAETFACGTGITASAVAAYLQSPGMWEKSGNGHVRIPVSALRDSLAVDFTPEEDGSFRDVWLTGGAVRVAVIETC